MKTAKLIIGIISIVLFVIIMVQSCAVGIGNALGGEEDDTSGGAGVILSFLVLISGITGVATRNSKGGGITVGVFYLIAGAIGMTAGGSFGDLEIWSWMCLIFGAIFLLGSIFSKKPVKQSA